jgi:glycosyltransferase involved in cell wall biosynthesis
MRIGIDGSCLANRRGFGRFARQLVEALGATPSRHEFLVFLDRPSSEQVDIPERFRKVVVDVREAPSRAASAKGRRRFGDMLAMGRAVARSGLDLIYFPATYTFFPVWNVPRVVVTMHDTLALAHPELVFPTWRGRLSWTLKEHAAARQSDTIMTVSESARRDLITWFKVAPERVRLMTEGPEAVFRPIETGLESDAVLTKYGLAPGARFLLYVGGLSPHKNLSRLIEAFSRLGRDDVTLALVGDLDDVFHTHVPELRAVITRFGSDGRVRLTGFVPDDELVHLYNRAYALIQPSLMEGFGLPPVEAMACGTPVLYSRAGSLPEVVGDAGRHFAPTDVGEMADTIGFLLDHPAERDRLSARALERSRQYSWSAAARMLLDAFEAIDPSWTRGRTA